MAEDSEPVDRPEPPVTPRPAVAPEPAATPEPAAPPAPEPAPEPEPEPAAAPGVPSESELERIAAPATLRRAPRYRAFAWAGVLGGLLAGVVLVLATAGRDDDVTGFALVFVALALAVVGAIVGGLVALVADRRSSARPRGRVSP